MGGRTPFTPFLAKAGTIKFFSRALITAHSSVTYQGPFSAEPLGKFSDSSVVALEDGS